MVKYWNTDVTFEEIPDEVSLCFNITQCQNNCVGCHSPYLKKDIGVELTELELDKAIKRESGVTCVCFMGEGNDQHRLLELIKGVKDHYGLKVALYSGRDSVEEILIKNLDYIKVGSYRIDKGGLNCVSTNQRLYAVLTTTDGYNLVDITKRFW